MIKIIKWLEKNRNTAIILTVLIAIGIFIVSSIPGGIVGVGTEITWKPTVYHILAFFLFNFFLLISIKGNKKLKISYIIIALAVSIIYAGLDEFHQIFVPLRAATLKDVLLDTAGALLSSIIYIFYSIRKK